MKIDEKILYNIYRNQSYYKGTDYRFIKDTIDSSDSEDGGADHTIIIQDIVTGKFYENQYTDWDIDHNFNVDKDGNVTRCDFDNELVEVIPVEKTIIVYERIKE